MAGENETIVYFVRHAQSVSNVGGVLQGADAPLTEEGMRQAVAIAERAFRLPELELIVASPYERARQTARVIQEHLAKEGREVSLREEALFRERRRPAGQYGLDRGSDAYQALEEKLVKHFIDPTTHPAPEGAESYHELLERARAALAWLAGRPERHLLVVTHATFLRTIVSVALLGDYLVPPALLRVLDRLRLANTSLTELAFTKGRWEVRAIGDKAHLG